eukprot:4270058-Pleurochrysis_carterae.AAC.2
MRFASRASRRQSERQGRGAAAARVWRRGVGQCEHCRRRRRSGHRHDAAEDRRRNAMHRAECARTRHARATLESRRLKKGYWKEAWYLKEAGYLKADCLRRGACNKGRLRKAQATRRAR